ncbi:hypothetical protein [Maridesulfovibrio sp. FT414]|uniref:hypothetical protein n=1 Tax=Maridesulfovibrio sp. FT414 TaxID=2979469 RepID=UPI003D800A8B
MKFLKRSNGTALKTISCPAAAAESAIRADAGRRAEASETIGQEREQARGPQCP